MGLQLPNLDDRTYTDLVDEARRLIPTYDPTWTNHNPSDPGVALIEMFAYLTELLLYRQNQVTTANRLAFVELLNGPDWVTSQIATHGPDWRRRLDIETETRLAVRSVRDLFRAVIPSDLEYLAKEAFNSWLADMVLANPTLNEPHEWWSTTHLDPSLPGNLPDQVPPIARAICISGLDLAQETESARILSAPGHVSVIVIPQPTDPVKAGPVRAALRGYLESRRALTMSVHVVDPCHAPVGFEIIVASTSDAKPDELVNRIQSALGTFLDPLTGGDDGNGWPLGHDVYISEIAQRLEAVAGVDYIADLALESSGSSTIPRCTEAPLLWHREGAAMGLSLARHHLPWAPVSSIDTSRIAIARSSTFIPLLVEIQGPSDQLDSEDFKRTAASAVRVFLHPLHNGPRLDSTTSQDFLTSTLKATIPVSPGVDLVVLFHADSSVLKPGGPPEGVTVPAGKLIDWDIRFTPLTTGP